MIHYVISEVDMVGFAASADNVAILIDLHQGRANTCKSTPPLCSEMYENVPDNGIGRGDTFHQRRRRRHPEIRAKNSWEGT